MLRLYPPNDYLNLERCIDLIDWRPLCNLREQQLPLAWHPISFLLTDRYRKFPHSLLHRVKVMRDLSWNTAIDNVAATWENLFSFSFRPRHSRYFEIASEHIHIHWEWRRRAMCRELYTFSVFPREMGRGLLGENFKFEMNNHRERHGSKRRTNRRTDL